MKTTRSLFAAAVLVPALLLAGCGGGDDTDDADDAGATPSGTGTPAQTSTESAPEPSSSTTTDEPAIPPITGDPCRSRVTLTGAVRKTWRVGGTVVTDTGGGPVAVYQSTDGKTALTAYAAGNGFSTSVIVNNGTESYGSAAGATGMRVRDDGSGATVDVKVVTPSTPKRTVRVRATFTC